MRDGVGDMSNGCGGQAIAAVGVGRRGGWHLISVGAIGGAHGSLSFNAIVHVIVHAIDLDGWEDGTRRQDEGGKDPRAEGE
jgi:hypothetical protein